MATSTLIPVSHKTRERLKKFSNEHGWTYDFSINKLLENWVDYT